MTDELSLLRLTVQKEDDMSIIREEEFDGTPGEYLDYLENVTITDDNEVDVMEAITETERSMSSIELLLHPKTVYDSPFVSHLTDEDEDRIAKTSTLIVPENYPVPG